MFVVYFVYRIDRAHHPSLIISERPRVFIFFFVFLSVFLTLLMEEGNQAVASAVGYGEHGMHDIIASKEKNLRKKKRKDYSISVVQQIHIAHTPHTTHGT